MRAKTMADDNAMTEKMTRNEVVRRRYEAMKMRWPEKTMTFITQEALIIAAPYLKKAR